MSKFKLQLQLQTKKRVSESNKIKSYFRIKNVRGNIKALHRRHTTHKRRTCRLAFLFIIFFFCFRLRKWSEIPGHIARLFTKHLCWSCQERSVLLGGAGMRHRENYVDKWKCHNDDNLFSLLSIAFPWTQLCATFPRHSNFHLHSGRHLWPELCAIKGNIRQLLCRLFGEDSYKNEYGDSLKTCEVGQSFYLS